MKTFVIDIDGVLAKIKHGITCSADYADCEVIEGASEATRKLYNSGWVILHSARREEDREVTVDWLRKNGIFYNHLVLDKPLGDVYIDDKALRFFDWIQSISEIERRS
jgi:hypothetical protein